MQRHLQCSDTTWTLRRLTEGMGLKEQDPNGTEWQGRQAAWIAWVDLDANAAHRVSVLRRHAAPSLRRRLLRRYVRAGGEGGVGTGRSVRGAMRRAPNRSSGGPPWGRRRSSSRTVACNCPSSAGVTVNGAGLAARKAAYRLASRAWSRALASFLAVLAAGPFACGGGVSASAPARRPHKPGQVQAAPPLPARRACFPSAEGEGRAGRRFFSPRAPALAQLAECKKQSWEMRGGVCCPSTCLSVPGCLPPPLRPSAIFCPGGIGAG